MSTNTPNPPFALVGDILEDGVVSPPVPFDKEAEAILRAREAEE